MTRGITDGPIVPAVLRLAWPVIVAEGLHTAFHLIDTAWVSGLGTASTAALTTSMFVVWIVLSLASLVNTGITAFVSRAVGGGDLARAGTVTTQALHLAIMLGALVAAAGWIGAPAVFRWVGAAPEVARQGAAYVRILALGSVISFLYLGGAAVMRARGDTRTPMIVTAGSVAANALLAPLLIYGWGPAPSLGVAGAAVATLICQLGAATAFAFIALRGGERLPFDRAALGRIDWRTIGALARVGAPYSVVLSLFSIVYLGFSGIAAAFGSAALAVVGVTNRLESINYLPADGFAAAAATMVGQNLGARQPERASSAAWTAVGTMGIAAALLTLLFLLIPAQLLRLFTRDPEVIALAVPYLRVVALCQIATGVEGVVNGAFAGAGNTVPPLVIHVVVSLLRLPLAWVAAVAWGMGIQGIAWTITLTCIARAAVVTGWFMRGRWRTLQGNA
jgi:putative MATE family efflux protein